MCESQNNHFASWTIFTTIKSKPVCKSNAMLYMCEVNYLFKDNYGKTY